MIVRFYLLFCLVIGWQSCLSDTPDLNKLGIDEAVGTGQPLPPGTEPPSTGVPNSTNQTKPGLAMQFLDAKEGVITSIRSGNIPKLNNSNFYKFGMLFEIRITYRDDAGNAIAAKQVQLQSDNRATIRQWRNITAESPFTAETDANGVAKFSNLYLVDAQEKVKITASADDKQVELEINTDSKPPDCYATIDRKLYANQHDGTASFCGGNETSDASNKFVDISATCPGKIADMDMTVDLNIYQLSADKSHYDIDENYSSNYNGTHADCNVLRLDLLQRKNGAGNPTTTAIHLYDNPANCRVAELHANFPLLPLVVYDPNAGNGGCS